MFEAGKRRGVAGLAYASSAAVYDRADRVRVAEDADGHPASHYGVHKQANVNQDVLLPLPEDMEASQPVTTPLRQGVLVTIELFRRAPP